jgi:palmitoyltransferase
MADSSLLDRIALGRTDLVFDWVAGGGGATAQHEGASLAQWCAYYGDVSGLRFLTANGAALQELGANFDLNGAAFHGHWRLCEYLLNVGADPNAALPDTGETPLHAALCRRESASHHAVVEVLLAAGADPDRKTTAGKPTESFMRDARTRGESPLHRAAICAGEPTIRSLIEAGATIDARDAAGETPLAWGSWALRDAGILRLLCYGAHRIRDDYEGMSSNLVGKPNLVATPKRSV